ncbi:Gfo/Idh/MocA family oxidoreductase [Henriciella marina]|uniref:Gfo/Idh/MocA family oxidoreductase n=1 Tax=Henriciella marina TaxID=453851 RepID=UPI00036F7398|nr:Gfo/Idh/MocA family oxidoreductase [Henriciella marina]
MKALRFAILGKSRLAVERLQAIEDNENTRIVRSYSAAQVSRFAKADWTSLLNRRHVDAIVLALPAKLAADAARRALLAGIHVLSELPGGLTVEDIINLREAETKSRAILKFGCSLRYHESVRAAEDLVRTQPYGELLTARATYGHAGFPGPDAKEHGVLLGHGIHMLDLLHVFFGPFESVKAMCPEGRDASANLFAILKAGTGAIAQLHTSATSWRQTFRLELGYERGYVWLDGHLPGLENYGPEMLIHAQLVQDDETGATLPNPEETVTEFASVDFASQELSEFIDAVTGKAPLRHGTSRHAFDAMNIAQRICAATETWA